MVLNMIITALMIKQGCVEDNRMVRMQQNNSKLINRNTRESDDFPLNSWSCKSSLLEQVIQGYNILKYTAILVVCQSKRSDKDWMYCHPNIICIPECPYSPLYVVIILFLHGIIAVVEFHLANVDNFVCPFYDEVYLCPFLFGLRCCP